MHEVVREADVLVPMVEERVKVVVHGPRAVVRNPAQSGQGSWVVREQARRAFIDRVEVLTGIADGKGTVRVQQVRVGRVESELVSGPGFRDRLKAMELLGKYAGLDRAEEPEVEEGKLVQAFLAALQDPGVRLMIQEKYPELIAALSR